LGKLQLQESLTFKEVDFSECNLTNDTLKVVPWDAPKIPHSDLLTTEIGKNTRGSILSKSIFIEKRLQNMLTKSLCMFFCILTFNLNSVGLQAMFV